MTHYLAITIGPIEKTIKQARKTRELWAASYIFSALMEQIILEMGKKNDHHPKLISPIVKKTAKNGAGIYPDRCFFEISMEMDNITLKDVVTNAINNISSILMKDQPPGFDPHNQFRVFGAQINSEEKKSSFLLQLNNILDALELQDLMPNGEVKLVSVLEDNIQAIYNDGGKNKVFISFSGQMRLPSLLELSTCELDSDKNHKTYNDLLTEPVNQAVIAYQRSLKKSKKERKEAEKVEAEAQENALIKLKNALSKEVKFRHKYVCYVKADGDAVGKTLGKIGNDEGRINSFSKLLGEFSNQAVGIVEDFGAIPVYAGGDDLLFIAPIQNKEGKHIFNLLTKLDEVFPSEKLYELNGIYNPTLSFGISIGYYKYPMSEAIENMDELLFEKAKNLEGKNAVAFRVLKHSGQPFGATIGKTGKSYRKFTALLLQCREQETAFLTSVMHKITELKPFLEDALVYKLCSNFFNNHFNEKVHSGSAEDNYITGVREFCETAWLDEVQRKEEEKKRLLELSAPQKDIDKIKPEIKIVSNQIFATLRFIQFLNQEDHD